MGKFHLKTGDTVIVISGKDKGKKGKVMGVDVKDGKILVENVNMVVRHTKPKKQGDQGGRLDKESPIYSCKVMRVCNKCGKATRVGRTVLENGQIKRCCKHCSEILDA